MSVREEDKNKNCPSRGLGLAAAAVGVGVGAALYYYFSKRPENPADEGSTSSDWEVQPCVLHESYSDHDSSYSGHDSSYSGHNSSYTTISEHSTTDTSIHDCDTSIHTSVYYTPCRRLWNSNSSSSSEISLEESNELNSQESNEFMYQESNEFIYLESNEIIYLESNELDSSEQLNSTDSNIVDELNASYERSIGSDSDMNMEWDVTNSSMDVPTDDRTPNMMQFGELTVRLLNPHSGWKSAEMEMNKRREQAFRERAWTLEECSICFEGMLKEQEVLALACTHRFHQSCILPWLEQQQTCPNCRKAS